MAEDYVERGKKRAIEEGWVIVCIDESAFSLTPTVHWTWSPEGETPTLEHNYGYWRKVNAITGVTSDRRFYFQLKDRRAINGEDVRRFLEMLLRHIEEKIVVLWDNVAQHRARKVKELAKEHERLRIEPIPPYSPDFNPDEGIYNHVKNVELANYTPRTNSGLVDQVRSTLRLYKNRPRKVMHCWRQSKLPLDGMENMLNLPKAP